jgi:putative membrane protein
MVMGAVGTYLLVGMVPVSTPNAPWFLFMSGAIAICAMILPGISGSLMLVLLGKYHYVLEAVNNHDFVTLLLVASGAGVGLITFVRLINWLLNRQHDLTMAVLTGLMLGSLRKVWPWKETMEILRDLHGNVIATQGNILPSHWNNEVTLALCLAIVGSLAVLSLNFFAEQRS